TEDRHPKRRTTNQPPALECETPLQRLQDRMTNGHRPGHRETSSPVLREPLREFLVREGARPAMRQSFRIVHFLAHCRGPTPCLFPEIGSKTVGISERFGATFLWHQDLDSAPDAQIAKVVLHGMIAWKPTGEAVDLRQLRLESRARFLQLRIRRDSSVEKCERANRGTVFLSSTTIHRSQLRLCESPDRRPPNR